MIWPEILQLVPRTTRGKFGDQLGGFPLCRRPTGSLVIRKKSRFPFSLSIHLKGTGNASSPGLGRKRHRLIKLVRLAPPAERARSRGEDVAVPVHLGAIRQCKGEAFPHAHGDDGRGVRRPASAAKVLNDGERAVRRAGGLEDPRVERVLVELADSGPGSDHLEAQNPPRCQLRRHRVRTDPRPSVAQMGLVMPGDRPTQRLRGLAPWSDCTGTEFEGSLRWRDTLQRPQTVHPGISCPVLGLIRYSEVGVSSFRHCLMACGSSSGIRGFPSCFELIVGERAPRMDLCTMLARVGLGGPMATVGIPCCGWISQVNPVPCVLD